MTTEEILTEIHATLKEILTVLKIAYPQAAKRLDSRWEGIFKPIKGTSDGVDRWPGN